MPDIAGLPELRDVLPSDYRGAARTAVGASGRFYPALDGLRAFAIGGVMLLHYLVRAPSLPTMLGRTFHTLTAVGGFGVDLFFVLSGFLITGILIDSRRSPTYFRTFYVRRSLRIFPLYYAALVLLGVVLPFIAPATFSWAPGSKMSLGWFWTYLANWPLAARDWGASPPTMTHFWTLAIEEQFYLVWPAVVFVTGRRRLVPVCLLLLAGTMGVRVALTYRWHLLPLLEVSTLARIDGLLIGAVVAVWWSSAQAVVQWRRLVLPTLVASGCAVVALARWRNGLRLDDHAVIILGVPLIVTCFGALLAVTLLSDDRSGLVRFLSWRPLRFIGRRSYGIYVLHYPILIALNATGLTMAGLLPRLHSTLLCEITIVGVNSVVAIGVATLSWRWFEQPILRLKSRFPYHEHGGRVPVSGVSSAAA